MSDGETTNITCQHNVIIKQYNIQYRTNNIGKHENIKQINLQYKLIYTTPRTTKIYLKCNLVARDNTNISLVFSKMSIGFPLRRRGRGRGRGRGQGGGGGWGGVG